MSENQALALWEEFREADLLGPDSESWRARLDPHRDALPAAVAALDANKAPELANAVYRLWWGAGDMDGSAAVLEPSLDGPPSRARVRALYNIGVVEFRRDRNDASRAYNERALAMARELEDAQAEALALVGLSRLALRGGDYPEVVALASSARDLIGRDTADDVWPLHLEAAGRHLSGDYAASRELYEESLSLNRRLGNAFMDPVELHNLVHVELHLGNRDAARVWFEELETKRDDSPYAAAMRELELAAFAHADGDAAAASSRLDACETTLAKYGIVLDPDDRYEVDRLRHAL